MANTDKEQINWQTEQMSPEVQELWLAAQQGDAEAQFKLGDALEYGKGIYRDTEEAIHWFRQAAEQGHILAKYDLSMYLNNDEGIYWLRQLAEEGYAEAQLNLAHIYRENDITQALYWLRQAAEAEDTVNELTLERASYPENPQNWARNELGRLYQFGKEGVIKDYEQAILWYKKAAEHGSKMAKTSVESIQLEMQYLDECQQAAEQGDAEAQYHLGRYKSENDEQAVDWLQKAAKQKHINAQFYLALAYGKGQGIAENKEQAVYWYRQIAEREMTELEIDKTQFDLNHRKNETEENYSRRMTWYRQEIRKRYVEAQFNLGYAYESGEGINQDDKQAVYWYQQAAENGHKRAQFLLGCAYYDGQGVPQDYQQAVYWYQQAAQDTDRYTEGDIDAQFNLACAYQKGEGISQDDGKAVYWYAKAGKGDADAQLQLGKLYDQANITQDYEQLFAWYRELQRNHYASQYPKDSAQTIIKRLLDEEDKNKAHYIQYFGLKGYKKHIVSECKSIANNCYQAAAEQGYSKALLYLGVQQTEKDSDESIRSLCQLAVNTIIENEEYDELELSEEEDEQAISALRKQADQGLSVAQTILAYLYKTGNAIPQDETKALFWFEKAAQQHDIVAQYGLGELYFEDVHSEKAQDYFQKASQNPHDGEYDELDRTKIESRAKDKLLVLKSIEQERKAKQDIEDIMAMFAHKFRGPLQSIQYNAEHDNQKQVTLQALQMMSGLLNMFSLIATDAELFQKKLQQDMAGNGTLKDVLEKALLLVIKQILTLDNAKKIRQHYLSYAKRTQQVPTLTTRKQWVEDYDVEEELQRKWEKSFSELLTKPEPLFDKLKTWFEVRFFHIKISGFYDQTIHFEQYGTTESTLHIVLTEILLNAIKYYYSETREPVNLFWQHDDDFCGIVSENPSHRSERSIDKGSKKGHKFLSIIARNLQGQFPNPLPKNTYRVEWRIPTDLLVKENK